MVCPANCTGEGTHIIGVPDINVYFWDSQKIVDPNNFSCKPAAAENTVVSQISIAFLG